MPMKKMVSLTSGQVNLCLFYLGKEEKRERYCGYSDFMICTNKYAVHS